MARTIEKTKLWIPPVTHHIEIPPAPIGERHPDLDCLPKKSIGEQVEMMIAAGYDLQEQRLKALLAGEDEAVSDRTALDEYADHEDIEEAALELSSRMDEIRRLRREAASKKDVDKSAKKEDNTPNNSMGQGESPTETL